MGKKGLKLSGQELVEFEKTFLPDLALVPLAEIATVRRTPQWLSDSAQDVTQAGTSFRIVTVDDLPVAGFIKSASRLILPAQGPGNLKFFSLQAYDLLLILHEKTVKMGIMAKDLGGTLLPDKDMLVVRFRKAAQENAFSLYVFLKTELGKQILERIQTKAKKHLPLLSVTLFSSLHVPILNENIIKEAAKAIEVEGKFYDKIADIKMVISGIFVDYFNKIREKQGSVEDSP